MTTEILDISKVVKVYSGKNGCMCGCKGKWSNITEGGERSIKIIAGKLARNENTKFNANANCFYVDDGQRTLAAYYE